MAFIKAQEARNRAANSRAVFDETNLIEVAIMDAVDAGDLTAKVGPGASPATDTGMSVDEDFYNAWVTPSQFTDSLSQLKREQMDRVISTFSALGYTVRREKVTSTTTFNWVITW